MNLWTQLIVDGQLVGPTEEPKWDAYSQQLDNILPRSPSSVKPNRSSSMITQSTLPTAIQNFLSFFTIQHQAREEEDRRRQSLEERRMEEQRRRDEEFRNLLMITMTSPLSRANNEYLPPGLTRQHSTPLKAMESATVASGCNRSLLEMSCEDVIAYLKREKVLLGEHETTLRNLDLDGATIAQLDVTSMKDITKIEDPLLIARVVGNIQKLKKDK